MLTKIFVLAVSSFITPFGTLEKIEGQITSTDFQKKTFEVKSAGKSRTIIVDEETDFVTKDNKSLSSALLPEGFVPTSPISILDTLLRKSKDKVLALIDTKNVGGKDLAVRVQITTPVSKMKDSDFKTTNAPMPGEGKEIGSAKWIGKKIPAFTMNTINDSKITNSTVKGKVVVIDFFASWCRPCRLISPIMQNLHSKYASKGLVVIGAGCMETGNSKRMTQEAAKSHGNKHVYTYGNDKLAADLNVSGVPTVLIIDRKGVIQMVEVGFQKDSAQKMDRLINKLLSQ